jgi:hypothetical protein
VQIPSYAKVVEESLAYDHLATQLLVPRTLSALHISEFVDRSALSRSTHPATQAAKVPGLL